MNVYELCEDVLQGEAWWRGLTQKETRFVREYLRDFNGTQAARRAGYGRSYRSWNRTGNMYLGKEKILRALMLALKELGVSAPALGMRIQRNSQRNLVRLYYFDAFGAATGDESDL